MIIYDEEKRLLNIKNHGIDFVNAQTVFDNFHITREDYREYGEQRFQTLGLYNNMVVVMMIHTPKNYNDRIISIRKATKNEQKYYWKQYPYS